MNIYYVRRCIYKRHTRRICSLLVYVTAYVCIQIAKEIIWGSNTHCNNMQHIATRCNALQYTAPQYGGATHTATHCNVL